MRRGIFGLAALLVTASLATAQDAKPKTMPAELQKQIDDHLIGEWTYEVTWGDKKYKGEERIRWMGRRTGVVTVGHEVMDGKRTHGVLLMGWDGEAKELVTRAFTADGSTWTSRKEVLLQKSVA